MKPAMSAVEAWKILGKEPQKIFARLASIPKINRQSAVTEDIIEARKLAKALMAIHHPDIGGDPKVFRRVNDAIMSLEICTEDYIQKLLKSQEKEEIKNMNRPVFIKLDKD